MAITVTIRFLVGLASLAATGAAYVLTGNIPVTLAVALGGVVSFCLYSQTEKDAEQRALSDQVRVRRAR